MATPPESPIEEVPFELEQARKPKPIPVALDELCRQTKFTKQEIRVMYRGFKTECPDGTVNEEGFKDIYTKFFPHGNTSVYAHLIFKAFDMNNSGSITFRDLLVVLNSLLKGSVYERLRWTFKLYDLDRDGRITKSELSEVILSVHELMGRKPNQQDEDRKAKEQQFLDQVEHFFNKFDIDKDGYITIEEYLEACLKDDAVTKSIQMFDADS